MLKEIYKIGEKLGLEKKDIDGILSNPEDVHKINPRSPTNTYKDGTRYGSISPNDF